VYSEEVKDEKEDIDTQEDEDVEIKKEVSWQHTV
jgi:hypothetical protein